MDTTRKLGQAKSTAILFLLTKNKTITEYYVQSPVQHVGLDPGSTE